MNNKIIAWYQGKAEIGPRALGHRSFIGLPTPASMKERLSERVKGREPYRPVSPTVLQSDTPEYFEFDSSSDYMSFAPVAKKIAFDSAPAIVHADGTARLQTITGATQPILAAILDELKKRGSPPIIMNSSFNVRGQPIVDTPDDALSTFKNCEADVLYINGKRFVK